MNSKCCVQLYGFTSVMGRVMGTGTLVHFLGSMNLSPMILSPMIPGVPVPVVLEAKETAVPFLPKGLLFYLILLCSSIKMEISPKSPISFGRTNMLFGFAYFIKCSFMESTSKSSMLLFVLKPIGSM